MQRLIAVLTTGLALGLGALIVSPALDFGFFADDFFMGDRIHELAEAEPGVLPAIKRAFVEQWTPHFDVFRPITILTLQADFAIHGADASGHHATNMALWLCCALAFALVIRTWIGPSHPLSFATAVLLFAAWPAGLECVGWVVAREDLLCALFAIVAFYVVLKRPHGMLFDYVLLLAMALGSKETAITLPFILAFADFLVNRPRGGTQTASFVRVLKRHWPAFLLLGAYFLIRFLLFNKIGGDYNGSPYSSYLTQDGAPVRIAESIGLSLVRLAAPINSVGLDRLFGLPYWPLALAMIVPQLALIAMAHWGRLNRRFFAWAATGLAWMVAPLLLLVIPLNEVGAAMDRSRFLILPMIGWMGIVAAALQRSVILGGARARWAWGLVALLIVAGAGVWQLNFDTYRHATERNHAVLSSLENSIRPGSRVIAFGIGAPGDPTGVHPQISEFEGCHLLSAGIYSATKPPFQPSPGIHLQPIPPQRIRSTLLLTVGTALENKTRPYITRLVLTDGLPHFEAIAESGHFGDSADHTPSHGTEVLPSWEPSFVIEGDVGPIMNADSVRVIVREPSGHSAIAEQSISGPPNRKAERYELRISGSAFHLHQDGKKTDVALGSAVIANLPHGVFWWWVEFRAGERLLVRTPYQVIQVAKQ